MSTLYISEYSHAAAAPYPLGPENGSGLPCPMAPAVCVQTIEIEEDGSQSKPFSARTCFVEVQADVDCMFSFGEGFRPLAAGQVRFFGVRPAGRVLVRSSE